MNNEVLCGTSVAIQPCVGPLHSLTTKAQGTAQKEERKECKSGGDVEPCEMPFGGHDIAIVPMNSQHGGYLYKTSSIRPSQTEFQYVWEGAHEHHLLAEGLLSVADCWEREHHW